MAFKSALENGKSAAYATYQGNVMGAIKLDKPASEMTKQVFLQVGRAVADASYKTQKSKDNFFQGWCEGVEGLIRLGHTFYAPVSTWIVEIRDSRGYENVESEETFEGTEEQAIEEGHSWLKEALTIDSYQKYVVVTRQEDGYTAYQGTFDMFPSGKEEEQGQEPGSQEPLTGMECIGKQYVMHNSVQVQAVVYTGDYATGLARITGPAIPVKFYENVEGANFPVPPGESGELKSIWVPASQEPQPQEQQEENHPVTYADMLVSIRRQLWDITTDVLTLQAGMKYSSQSSEEIGKQLNRLIRSLGRHGITPIEDREEQASQEPQG